MNGTDGIAPATRPKLTSDTDTVDPLAFINLGQASRIGSSGAADMSDTVKGIATQASAAQALAGTTNVGSTTAPTVVSPVQLLQVRDAHWSTDYTYGATISAGQVLFLDPADAKLKVATSAAAATADAALAFICGYSSKK